MRDVIFEVRENKIIARDVYEMLLKGDASDITRPGQFINIKLDGFYLRRPISVCECGDDFIRIIYKVVGEGTEYMKNIAVPGTPEAEKRGVKDYTKLDVLTALGNGFDTDAICSGKTAVKSPVIAGGGVGVPPLYGLAKELKKKGVMPDIVLGFNSVADVFYEEKFDELGLNVKLATVDGSRGVKGFVTDLMYDEEGKPLYDYVFTCGPEPMLKAVYNAVPDGQFSFEARMACGFGACMGCSCETKYGSKRICKDGPVLRREEIIW